ncbi:MAG: M3 family metallopeptidase [Firmicutes bacterium]|nr:M3 family metallopeptidase [Bacillota bacterium]
MRAVLPLSALVCLLPAMSNTPAATPNPFFTPWKTPYGAPPFAEIKSEHYVPAFKEGMARHKAEVKAIAESKQKPTFANTIEALEKSGSFLEPVATVFYSLSSAETNAQLQAINREVAPLLSAHRDDVNFNDQLWLRVKAVWEGRSKTKLNPEQTRLLEDRYKGFVRAGAALAPAQKEQMRAINAELSKLGVQYGDKLLKATKDYQLVVDKASDLAGLPEGVKNAAAEAATRAGKKGAWLFTLDGPSLWPFLQYADNRELRRQMLTAYTERCNGGDQDTRAIASRIAALRVEKAKLLGFPTWADFVLADNMAKNPKNVFDLLDQLWKPALNVAKRDRAELQAMMEKDHPGEKLQAWDWRYYEEKVRKARFDLDEEALKPYFALDHVREGAFMVAHKLYGITFTERKGLPVYHPEVKVFEVKEKDGRSLGLFYVDYHPRPGKRGGAWCGRLRSGYGNVKPIVTNVCNFTRPEGGKPALLTLDEVETLFHEFGHALHGFFYHGQYKGLASTPRDFVELPSQVMENWAMEPQVLKLYAKHYQTGQPMPDALIQKIHSAGTYGQGFKTTEYLAASLLDMAWHTLSEAKELDAMAFEKTTLDQRGLLPEIPARYRTPYFNHIWGGGYSAGYYAYVWSEVLDADAFQAFKEKGDLFHPATAKAFRRLLSMGGIEPGDQLYRTFRGRDPKVEPLLERRGLK